MLNLKNTCLMIVFSLVASTSFAQMFSCKISTYKKTFQSADMRIENDARNDVMARCNSDWDTKPGDCSSIQCESKGQSNKLQGLQFMCRIMSNGQKFEITSYSPEEAKSVVTQCRTHPRTNNDDCEKPYCTQIKKTVSYQCAIDKIDGDIADVGSTLEEAIRETIKTSQLPEDEAKARMFCKGPKGDAKKAFESFKCESKTVFFDKFAVGTNLESVQQKTLEGCMKGTNDRVGRAACRTNLSCEGDKMPLTKIYKSFTCSTQSNGIDIEFSDISVKSAQREILALCDTEKRVDNGECRAHLTCDNRRAYPKVYTCETSSEVMKIKQIDIDENILKKRTQVICETTFGADSEDCEKNMKCDVQNNAENVRFKASKTPLRK